MDRPPRKTVPVRIRRIVCERQTWRCKCGCGDVVYAAHGQGTHFDHEPALILRDINEAGDDYIPGQLDPVYLDAYANISHAKAKTSGSGATTAGTDIGKMKKERKRGRPPKPKRKIPSRPFSRLHRPLVRFPDWRKKR